MPLSARQRELIEKAKQQVEQAADGPPVRSPTDPPDSTVTSGGSSGLDALEAGSRQTGMRPPPDAIPGYEILREVYKGGQGVVYEAMQKGTQRRVAVKVLRESLFPGGHDKVRFDREIRILGRFHHPHIVAIHDSGSCAHGFYYVMDFIDGQPLDDFAAAAALTTEQTLRLFGAICDTVNAAHLKGVIHRDLKPKNILIDRSGSPHVLDFGLAKLIQGDMEDGETAWKQQTMTAAGQFIGTLPWCSPEQAQGDHDKVDVRTDVYTLGLILHYMLTQGFPYSVEGSGRQILANVISAEPKLGESDSRRINQELGTVILKALNKDQKRRYQTAGDLAGDIRRYMAGEPIEAKRDNSWYMLRKTVRRYKVHSAVAAVFALLILGFSIALGVMYRSKAHQFRQAVEAKRLAEEQRTAAVAAKRLAEEQRAEAVAARNAEREASLEAQKQASIAKGHRQLSRTVFGAVIENLDATTIEDVFAAAEELLERGLSDRPDAEAELREFLGVMARGMGRYDLAGRYLKQALEIRSRSDDDPLEVARSKTLLARARMDEGKTRAATALLGEALRTQRDLLPVADPQLIEPQLIETLVELASALDSLGRPQEADTLAQEAESLLDDQTDKPRRTYLLALPTLGRIHQSHKQYSKAFSMFQRVLGKLQELQNSKHDRDIATCLANMGEVLMNVGDYAAATMRFRQAVDIGRNAFPENHPRRLIHLSYLPFTLAKTGDFDEAGRIARELAVKAQGAPDLVTSDSVNALNNLGAILVDQGDFLGAESALRESDSILRDSPNAQACGRAAPLRSLARLAMYREDYAGAAQLFEESDEVAKTGEPVNELLLASNLNDRGALHCLQGDYDRARVLLDEALDRRRRLRGNIHHETGISVECMAKLCHLLGDRKEAEFMYRRAWAIYRAVLGEEHPWAAAVLTGLATVVHEQGDSAAALELSQRALAIQRGRLLPFHTDIADSLMAQARIRMDDGDVVEAHELADEALGIYRTVLPSSSKRVTEARSLIERCLNTNDKDSMYIQGEN